MTSGEPSAAQVLAERLHAGQIDKAGQPYVGHLRRVAEILIRRWSDAEPRMHMDAVGRSAAQMASLPLDANVPSMTR